MISKDFVSFVEFRENLFKLIESMVENCYEVFLIISEETFRLLIDCIVWALKHDSPVQS